MCWDTRTYLSEAWICLFSCRWMGCTKGIISIRFRAGEQFARCLGALGLFVRLNDPAMVSSRHLIAE